MRNEGFTSLEILGLESRVLGDFGQHLGADFDRIMECPRVFTLRRVGELSMGAAGTTADRPSDSQ